MRGSQRDGVRLVHEAVDLGVTVFDTADVYGRGRSERILGAALGPRRSTTIIATKGGYVFRPRSRAEQLARRAVSSTVRVVRGPSSGTASWSGSGGYGGPQDFSPAALRHAVEASLRRLQTDHIDVYQLHGPHRVMPELFEELADLVREGKVGRFGVGAESVAAAADWVPVAGTGVVQLPFGVLDPEARDQVFPAAGKRSVELWARGVLGGGVLAAALRDPASIATHPKHRLILEVCRIADEAGIAVDELAVGFVRAHTDVSTLLLGISSREHLHRNIELMQRPLPARDVVNQLQSTTLSGP